MVADVPAHAAAGQAVGPAESVRLVTASDDAGGRRAVVFAVGFLHRCRGGVVLGGELEGCGEEAGHDGGADGDAIFDDCRAGGRDWAGGGGGGAGLE